MIHINCYGNALFTTERLHRVGEKIQCKVKVIYKKYIVFLFKMK